MPADAGPPAPGAVVRQRAQELSVDLSTVRGTGLHGRITKHDVEQAAAAREESAAASQPPTPTVEASPTRVRTTPHARRLADELGVDLETLAGAEEPLRAADVRRAAAAGAGRPVPGQSRVSPAELEGGAIPHYYLATSVDLAAAMSWMHDHNRGLPERTRLTPQALLLKATARALQQVPGLNGAWAGRFHPASRVDLAVAVGLPGGGVVTPTVAGAERLALGELMAAVRERVDRALAGNVDGGEAEDATATVTDLGGSDVEAVHEAVRAPQVAHVGLGKVVDRPWAVDGLLGVRPVTTVTLAADRRATDGFAGARLLGAIAAWLQRPEEL